MKKFALSVAIACLIIGGTAVAETNDGEGKITSLDGHIAPACTMVKFLGNNGVEKTYRIDATTDGGKQIHSVALAALISGRKVRLWRSESAYAKCGPQVSGVYEVIYITIM